jgi:hypothetical protein
LENLFLTELAHEVLLPYKEEQVLSSPVSQLNPPINVVVSSIAASC